MPKILMKMQKTSKKEKMEQQQQTRYLKLVRKSQLKMWRLEAY